MGNKRPEVVFFQRKPIKAFNFSVEFIFEDVRKRLGEKIVPSMHISKYDSSGLFKRLYNCFDAWRSQGQVNHVTGDINYIGLFLGKRRTIHTILDCVFIESSSGLKRAVLKLFWLTIPVRRSRYITAISEATKKEILRHAPCDPEKIVVIPVAISQRFKRKDKPFNKDKPVILQIGSAPNKNIPRIIEALQGISCKLEMVGKYNPAYEELLKQAGIEYSYNSGLSDEAMMHKYEEADILIFASTYEGFGMPILEAQAIGRPVVTSDLLSMPEVAGGAACLVDPFSVESIRKGVLRVMQDDNYRERLVLDGFQNIKRYDPQVIADQYLHLYLKMAAGPNSARVPAVVVEK